MKKFLVMLLALLVSLFAVGCTSTLPDNPDKPDKPLPPDELKNPFTVTLYCNGEAFKPQSEMKAQWYDGSSRVEAVFDENGKAAADGLDGDYSVTLLNVPDGYTYNPNIYSADNDNRDINIELYEIIPLYGKGTDLYRNVIEITSLGVYRLTFTEKGQNIYCQYEPKENGMYSIESIMDINANEINPRLDVYRGSKSWKPETPTSYINEGGVSSVYTKNFKYEVNIMQVEIGSVYAFAVKFDSRIGVSEENPVYIDFVIARNGEFQGNNTVAEAVIPKELLDKDGNLIKAPEMNRWEYALTDWGEYNRDTGRTLLDGSNVVYSDPLAGGDGYYHILNSDGTVSDNLVYANMSSNRVIDYNNELISMVFGGKNYAYLIRGYTNSYTNTDGIKIDLGYLGTIQGGEQNIPPETKAQIEALDYKTYKDCVNSDGVYPVTKELKEFFQSISAKQTFFWDGCGFLDGPDSDPAFDAAEKDWWLFACCYYKPI